MLHGWQYLRAEDIETIARGIESGEVLGGPFHIELDWVNACNAKCFFCATSDLHSEDSISWERTRGLLEEARAGGLRSIRLAGGGEPLLHPEFDNLAEWLNQNDIVLDQLNTNGIALSDARIAALMKPRTAEVHVSLNYPDRESYAEGMRLPAQVFDKVCENIKRLDHARKTATRFGRLSIQFFVYKRTLDQIVNMYRLGRELGADRISFMELRGIDPALQYEESDVPKIAAQMREVMEADKNEGTIENLLWSRGAGPAIAAVQNEIRPPAQKSLTDFHDRYCYIAWYSMTIIGSEAVYPCCFLLNDPRPLDDLRNRSLNEVWRGAEYQRLRKEFRRWFLLGMRVPMFDRRNKHLRFGCASHTDCPMSIVLADAAFYAAMDERLEALRRRPAQRLRIIPERLGRMALDKLRPR